MGNPIAKRIEKAADEIVEEIIEERPEELSDEAINWARLQVSSVERTFFVCLRKASPDSGKLENMVYNRLIEQFPNLKDEIEVRAEW